MKHFFKSWGVLATIAVIIFILWLLWGILGNAHSAVADILGILAITFSIMALFNMRKGEPTTDWSKMVQQSFPLLISLVLVTYFLESALKITWFPEAMVAYGTLFLAYATYQLGQTTQKENAKLIAQNKSLSEENQKIHEEDRERESKRRRLDDVQHWIERVLESKSKHSVLWMGQEEMLTRVKDIQLLLSSASYILLEAQRLDSDLERFRALTEKYENGLEDLIKELCDIFTQEVQNPAELYTKPSILQNIEDKGVEALHIISDLRAELKL